MRLTRDRWQARSGQWEADEAILKCLGRDFRILEEEAPELTACSLQSGKLFHAPLPTPRPGAKLILLLGVPSIKQLDSAIHRGREEWRQHRDSGSALKAIQSEWDAVRMFSDGELEKLSLQLRHWGLLDELGLPFESLESSLRDGAIGVTFAMPYAALPDPASAKLSSRSQLVLRALAADEALQKHLVERLHEIASESPHALFVTVGSLATEIIERLGERLLLDRGKLYSELIWPDSVTREALDCIVTSLDPPSGAPLADDLRSPALKTGVERYFEGRSWFREYHGISLSPLENFDGDGIIH
jgi:hypothetical protein